jgi:aerobic carbon-monoxide dehydrogenase medium subunit
VAEEAAKGGAAPATRPRELIHMRLAPPRPVAACFNPAVLLNEVEYARPASVEEALELLSQNDNARALAGGQTLINVMKQRLVAPDLLVDLAELEELTPIMVADDGSLELGAMATLSDLIGSQEVRDSRPILAEVASRIADVQVRNRGTVGGNVCSNDPTNHLPPLMVATGATMTIAGPEGTRTVSAEEFFLGVYMTAVGPGELLTGISIPAAGGSGDGFFSVTVGNEGTGIVNVAATVNGEARIAIGCVAAVPVLVTSRPDDDSVREAVRSAELDPPFDVHGSGAYRRHLAEVLALRAVAHARSSG